MIRAGAKLWMPDVPEFADDIMAYATAKAKNRNNPDDSPDPDKRPYRLRSIAEAYKTLPEIVWCVDGLLAAGSLNILAGAPGSAKTFTAFDLAICVATGADWLEYSTTKTPVLIVDEESGITRLLMRLQKAINGHDLRQSDPPPVTFTSLAHAFNLHRNDDGKDALIQAVSDSEAGLIIIDSLVALASGADENKVADMYPVMAALRHVAETTGAAILMIHHTGKSKAGGYRGSSAISGAVDLLLEVERDPDDGAIIISTVKARDIESTKFAAIGHWTDTAFSMESTKLKAARPRLSLGQKYILFSLAVSGPMAAKELREQAPYHSDHDCSPVTAKNAIYKLRDAKHIERTNKGGKGIDAIWELTDSGRAIWQDD